MSLGQRAWKLYTELKNAGFHEGQCLGLVSQWLCHMAMQDILNDKADFNIIVKEKVC